MRLAIAALSLLALSGSALAAQVDDRAAIALARPQELIVDRSLPAPTVAAMLKPVDAFYGFWNNGSQALLDEAIAPAFTDHTLPPGRPQGPRGPAAASKVFLAAVPDLEAGAGLCVQSRHQRRHHQRRRAAIPARPAAAAG